MLYPKNFEEKIGFDQIRQLIKDECNGIIGKNFVDKIRFSDKIDIIAKLTGQVEEFRKILVEGEEFPNQYFYDLNESLSKAAIENAFLIEEEFQNLKLSLSTLLQCLSFFAAKDVKKYPHLKELCADILIDKNLVKKIEQVIDDRSKVRDNASPKLREIRMSLLSEQSRLRKSLDSILKSLKGQNLVNDDVNLTIREGRMVIPLAAEYKRRIKGFVHDTSASGQTVYIEPEEVLNINNEIRELEYAERHEVIRILIELTTTIRPHIPALKKGYLVLGIIDFIRAKARFALKINAIQPELVKQPYMDWRNAYHSLLYYSFSKIGKTVVPLSIKLDENNRILLISGPNAGGKSVCLKTVGLTQYMLQCGLLIPVEEGSKAGIFDKIFIDIGDEQSIESDLSTYSSHLKNMKHFLQFGDKKTLCLIDEFGTGTDPQFGGAIAEAVLEKLNLQQIFGVITTHFTNLKLFAETTKGIENGAMRFDTKNLEPLFMLEIGKPGSSFALEIAQKIGLSKELIGLAKERIGSDKTDMEKLLRDLEVEKRFFRERNKENELEKERLQRLTAEYEKLTHFINSNRKQLLNEAKEEAKKVVKEANQKIEAAIRDIKESAADKDLTKLIRKDLEDFKQALKPEIVPILEDKNRKNKEEDDEITVIGGEIGEGDYVQLDGSNTVGRVISINKKDVSVAIGELKSNIKLNRLVKISRKEFRQKDIVIQNRGYGLDMVEKQANFSFDIDVRGNRVEEVLPKIENFIDNAVMLGYNQVRIVHGKGDGILRQVIRETLRKYKQVRSTEDEHADRGGAGITVVNLV
jgi:DNA mismatch repair protein MutS2